MWLPELSCLLLLGTLVSGKRILLLPFQMASHVAELCTLSEGLIDQGHEVYMLIGDKAPTLKRAQESRAKILLHKMPSSKPKMPDFKAKILSGVQTRPLDDLRRVAHAVNTCHHILGDQDLFQQVRSLGFDFAVIDGIPYNQCLYILAYRLDLPYATFTIGPDPCQMGSPTLPSFVPWVLGDPFTDRMDFWQRLRNAWTLLDWCYDSRVASKSSELVSTYAPEKPHVSVDELARRTQLWLLDSEAVLDYPQPLMPNVVYVGGLMVKEGKTLAANFREIVEGAKEGVIVMSFGSSAPDIKQEVFLEAFAQIKQTVLWRYKGEPLSDVPPNVHVFDWLPQADLLAHPSVKLFITHCGANGQMESVYNGVPMVHFPVFAEQPFNALRSQHHGYGLTLSLASFTSGQLVDTIRELTTNPTYREKVSRASQIIKARPHTPLQRAVHWIEHVMTFGADHLMAHSLKMPWYQLLMLDILAFVIGVLIAALVIIRIIIKILLRICCGSNSRKVKVN